jgi:hypothetical protein
MQFEKILPDLAGKELCSFDHVLWSKVRTIWLPLHGVGLPPVVDEEKKGNGRGEKIKACVVVSCKSRYLEWSINGPPASHMNNLKIYIYKQKGYNSHHVSVIKIKTVHLV